MVFVVVIIVSFLFFVCIFWWPVKAEGIHETVQRTFAMYYTHSEDTQHNVLISQLQKGKKKELPLLQSARGFGAASLSPIKSDGVRVLTNFW